MCVLLTCLVGKINVVNSNQSVFRVWNGCITESIRYKITLFEMGLAKIKFWFRLYY